MIFYKIGSEMILQPNKFGGCTFQEAPWVGNLGRLLLISAWNLVWE